MYHHFFKQMEEILKINLERRGMEKAFIEGELRKVAESLIEGSTVFIVTGFVIRLAMAGETDGPVGAASIAGALEQIGKKVVLITDNYSEDLLKQCCKVRGVEAPLEIISMDMDRLHFRRLIEIYKPSHAIAIERPGRALNGRCYSMRGEDISDIIPDMDNLFEEAKKMGITTIGIGDGGNELGMGKVRPLIAESVQNGGHICAVLPTDFLIAAGVSNWAGHALAAALSVLSQRMLLHNMNTEISMLKSMIEAGAVDGYTGKRTITVDGLSLEENLSMFMNIKKKAAKAIGYAKNELAPTKI